MNRVPTEVLEYLSDVPGERGEAVRAVFDTAIEAMPAGYELVSFQNAPHWVIPLSTFPVTHNGEPLSYLALMAQKHYNSAYLMGLYKDVDAVASFQSAWTASGLPLDMGAACLRVKRLADVNLPLLAETIASMPVQRYLEIYQGRSSPKLNQ